MKIGFEISVLEAGDWTLLETEDERKQEREKLEDEIEYMLGRIEDECCELGYYFDIIDEYRASVYIEIDTEEEDVDNEKVKYNATVKINELIDRAELPSPGMSTDLIFIDCQMYYD